MGKTKGQVYKNKLRPLISNLDELSWEDYDFTNQYFLDARERIVKYDGRRIGAQSYRSFIINRKGFGVMLSRGCPFSCTFCYNHDFNLLYQGINNNTLRRKSVSAAIAEMCHYKENLKLNEQHHFISFDDDEFFARPVSEIEQFCSEYSKKIKIPFGCHVHVQSFEERKLRLLIDAGSWVLTAGVQTGSDRINREIYKRNVTREKVLEVAKILQKYSKQLKSLPSYHVINTNPFEEEDVWETINLINSLPRPFNVQVFQLSFFPNSWLTKKALSSGLLSGEKELAFEEHYYNAISYARRRKKYRYAWFLLNLMVGLHTAVRMGSVSSVVFKIFSNKRIRSFFEKHAFLAHIFTYLLILNSAYPYKRYALPYAIKRRVYFIKDS